MNLRNMFKRLNVQLVFLLTLALLPLGAVAIYQTTRVSTEADKNAGLAFLALTDQAARSEQILIERAVGAARLFASIAPDLLDDPATCVPVLSRFVEGNPDYSFIGVVPLSGVVACSSSEQSLDFSNSAGFDDFMEAQQPTIVVNSSAPFSGQSVFIVSDPFNIDGEFAGFISVSIPHKRLPDTTRRLEEQGLIELITFNDDGAILTSRSDQGSVETELPRNIDLANLSLNRTQTFRAENANGVERRYSIVEIEGSPAAVMAIWNLDKSPLGRLPSDILASVFPVLMWIASMGVAMLAMNTLVLRHLRRLRRKMSNFAANRQIDTDDADLPLTPIEIEDLETNLEDMAKKLLQDEAELEDTLREKGVLVKEIHHRVKNNLQLISSIMNMQIRSADHKETRDVLSRIQDRVISLATIHRDLYQSQDGGRVNAGNLVTDIVEKSVELAIADGGSLNLETDIDQLRLYPDQAVPLSLLVAEATTNAMKYLGDTNTSNPSISVRLKNEDRACVFSMTNTIGTTEEQESTGLGSKLMKAFAIQLGGSLDIEHTETQYSLTLKFNALEFEPEVRDF